MYREYDDNMNVCLCLCVCMRARVRVCVCVCMCSIRLGLQSHVPPSLVCLQAVVHLASCGVLDLEDWRRVLEATRASTFFRLPATFLGSPRPHSRCPGPNGGGTRILISQKC